MALLGFSEPIVDVRKVGAPFDLYRNHVSKVALGHLFTNHYVWIRCNLYKHFSAGSISYLQNSR